MLSQDSFLLFMRDRGEREMRIAESLQIALGAICERDRQGKYLNA